MKKITALLSVIFYCTIISAQTKINNYEYWFDNNYAGKVSASITPPVSNYNLNELLNANSLTTGFHIFNVRFKDNLGVWSTIKSQYFFKGSGQINGYEYWLDDNYNQKVANTVAAANSLVVVQNINANSISTGLHKFNIRFKDALGVWSVQKTQYFFKSSGQINGYEYWFDESYNQKISATVNATDSLVFVQEININSLNPGYHIFWIRFKDVTGNWSVTKSSYFINTSVGGNPITAYRYWFDAADTTLVNLETPTNLTTFTIEDSISTSPLLVGYHKIHYQFKDTAQLWSSVNTNQFRKVGDARLDTITPSAGGNTGYVTCSIYGDGFYDGMKVFLAKGVDTINVPDSMKRIVDGKQIVVTFQLDKARIGYYDLVVIVPQPYDTSLILKNGFEVEPDNRGYVQVQLQGPPIIRRNSAFQMNVLITNTSNIDKLMPIVTILSLNNNTIGLSEYDLVNNFHVLPIELDTNVLYKIPAKQTLEKTIFSKTLENGVCSYEIFQLTEKDFQSFYDTLMLLTGNLSAPSISNNSSKILDENCNPNGCSIWSFLTSSIYISLFNDACNRHDQCYGTPFNSKLYCDSRFLQDMMTTCDCSFGINTAAGNECIVEANKWYEGLRLLPHIAPEGSPWNPDTHFIDGQASGGCTIQPLIADCPQGCPSNVFYYENNDYAGPCYSASVIGSVDPNEKYGPTSLDTINRYISNVSGLNYIIQFENDSAATAPAQTVKIYDTLDRKVFNTATFQLGNVTIGDTTIRFRSGVKEDSVDIDLSRLGTFYVARVKGKLIDSSGVAYWEFQTLNPYTLKPATGLFDGFLPPNTVSPKGIGGVSYNIKVYDTLSLNSEIKNKAYIYFDYNPGVVTGTWQNKLDNQKPQSKVNALPGTTKDTLISLTWQGTDVGSGLLNFDIYYSVNNGPYQSLLLNTTSKSYTFNGKRDSSYAFYSIAKDSALNKEEAPLTADATTIIRFITISETHSNVKCNGTNTGSINITVTGAVAPVKYKWSSGAVTEDLNNIVAGTYIVTVTDASGIKAKDTIIITQPLAITTQKTQKNESFPGAANGTAKVTPSGGTPPYSYLWSNNAVTQEITGLIAGQYTCRVTDSNGCKKNIKFTITANGGFVQSSDNGSELTQSGKWQAEISPNPTKGIFKFVVTGVQNNVSVLISDGYGRQLYNTDISYKEGKSMMKEINLTSASKGVYYIIINNGGESKRYKLVII